MIEVNDSKQRIKLFYVGFDRQSISKDGYNSENVLSISGKICNVETVEKIKNDCFFKYTNYNYEWVILINK
jgi:hypothetical protein